MITEDVKQKIAKDILYEYRQQLLQKRRKEQVNRMMEDSRLIGYTNKCTDNLIKWKIPFEAKKYVRAQFFALNYMPYLPSMIHISSNNGLERYNKVKDWFEKKIGREIKKKVQKKKNKEPFSKKDILDLLKIQDFEEDDKKTFHNKKEGFLSCLEFTTLYNPKSKLCIMCRYKPFCKKVLEERCRPLLLIRLKKISRNIYIKRMKGSEFL